MYIGNANHVMDTLMNSRGTCPNCGAVLVFDAAAQLAKSNGIQDNVVMCKDCNHVFEVELGIGHMTLTRDVTARYPQIKPKRPGGIFKKFRK